MNKEKAALEEIERVTQDLVDKGKLEEAIDHLESELVAIGDKFGEDSREYILLAIKLADLYNTQSMIYLKNKDYESSLYMLKKADELRLEDNLTRGTTLNNFATYCRKLTLKLYLLAGWENINLRTRLHEQARDHIMQAIIIYQDEFISMAAKDHSKVPNGHKVYEERVSILAISYHNLGVEYEYLHDFQNSLISYKKAYSFAKIHLKDEHPVFRSIEKVYNEARKSLEDKMRKKNEKSNTNINNSTSTSPLDSKAQKFKQTMETYRTTAPKGSHSRVSSLEMKFQEKQRLLLNPKENRQNNMVESRKREGYGYVNGFRSISPLKGDNDFVSESRRLMEAEEKLDTGRVILYNSEVKS